MLVFLLPVSEATLKEMNLPPLLFSPLKADVTQCHADNDLLIVWDSRSTQLEKVCKDAGSPHVVGQGN